jgi:hypothetical protein
LQDSELTNLQDPVHDDEPSPSKKAKLTCSSSISFPNFLGKHSKIVETLSSVSVGSFISVDGNSPDSGDTNQNESVCELNSTNEMEVEVPSPTYLEHLINAVGHHSVLKEITAQFLKNVTSLPPK